MSLLFMGDATILKPAFHKPNFNSQNSILATDNVDQEDANVVLKGGNVVLKGASVVLKGASVVLEGDNVVLEGSNCNLVRCSVVLFFFKHKKKVPICLLKTRLGLYTTIK